MDRVCLRLIRSALAGVVLFAVALPAKAGVKESGQFILSLSDKATETLQKQHISLEAREAIVRSVLIRSSSLNTIGKDIIGSKWVNVDKGLQRNFLKQFREWVLKTYASCLGGYKGQTFEIIKTEDVGKDGVLVRNKISLAGGGGSFICDWRVGSALGKYKILDVGFEGSNLRSNQKRLFSTTIKANGVVGLVELLKMRNSKLPVVGGAFEAGSVAYQKTDFLAAMYIWKPLAESGDARAQYNMGVLYDQGQGVARDKKKAKEWWEKSANQNFPQALHNLASSYLFDEGQHDKAVSWLNRSAKLGVARSQYSLGKVYLHAHGGIKKDDVKARIWIEKAALQGFDKAQYNMGKIMRDGIGGDKDTAAAAQWFLKAAKQGYAKAQRNIGKHFLKGDGIGKNEAEALFWLTLAANQGEMAGEEDREALQKKLSKDQVQKVERSVKAWKPE